MSGKIPIVGSYSIGQTLQWDGLTTPAGFLLRWFVDPSRGFPQLGFRVFWTELASFLITTQSSSSTVFEILDPSDALTFASWPGTSNQSFLISTDAGASVVFSFSQPTMGVVFLEVMATDTTQVLQISGSLGGKVKVTASVSGVPQLNLDWSFYVLDAVTFTGSGYVSSMQSWPLVELSLLNLRPAPRFCLPVTDRVYPCAQLTNPTGTGLQIAMSRLPSGVDTTKYTDVYNQMAPTLGRIATGAAMQPIQASTAPNAPTLNANEGTMLQMALLDPHVAEMLGMMCILPRYPHALKDQPKCQAFVVLAFYLDARHFKFPANTSTYRTDFRATGLSWSGPVNVSYKGDAGSGLGPELPFSLSLNANTQANLSVTLTPGLPLKFQTLDGTGAVIHAWSTIPAAHERKIGGSNVATVQFAAGSAFAIKEISWDNLDIADGICAVDAIDYGAPAEPSWTSARVKAAAGVTGVMTASLDWNVVGDPALGINSTDPAFYQAVRGQLSNDPAAPKPAATATPQVSLINLSQGNFIIVPPALYGVEPRTLLVDIGVNNHGVPDGWQGYWVRSVDIFGRCSSYGPPAVVRVVDDSLPPPPIIVAAEYIQANAIPANVQFSRSVAAKKWLEENPTTDGLSATIGWTPETALSCRDVDGFSLSFQLNNPIANPNWNVAPYTSILLNAIGNTVTLQGTLDSWAPADSSTFQPTITTVTAISSSFQIPGAAAPPMLAVCQTNLSLDAGGGIFAGWTLVAADGSSFPVVMNGNGANLTITVQCPDGTLPTAGNYSLSPPTSGSGPNIVVIQTSIAPSTVDPADNQRWRSGGLLFFDHTAATTHLPYCLIVIGSSGGTFWCSGLEQVNPPQASAMPTGADIPPAGTSVMWYPVYTINVAGAPFSMAPSPATPKTAGQVAARSLRLNGSIHSGPSVPTTVTAADVTIPSSPTLTSIQTEMGDYCAQLAGPADWYGDSLFPASPGGQGLTWVPVTGMQYNVYRAFDQAIWMVDFGVNSDVHDVTTMSTPTLTALQSNAARLAGVVADFQALDTALKPLVGTSGVPATAIFAAYDALHADAQQVLAELNIAPSNGVGPFVLLTNSPITPPSLPYTYQDTLEGRAQTHWFYCIAAVSATGIQGPYSACTPPICCPKTVPPRKPTLLSALLTGFPGTNPGNVVYLCLIGNAETDIVAYNIYCMTAEQSASFDPRFAVPFQILNSGANWPLKPNIANSIPVTPPAPGKWYFCVTAIDDSNNMSDPSGIVSAKTFPPYPKAPTNFQVSPAPAGLAAGVGLGPSVITAAIGSVSGNTTLTVSPALLQAITVTPANQTIPNGVSQQFTATGLYSDGTSHDISALVAWSSAAPANAPINGSGLASGVAVGASVITATIGSVSGNTTITVNAAVLQTITLTPANPSIPNGLTQRFTATGNYSDGSSHNVSALVTWTSRSVANATVSSSGLAEGVAVGSSVIGAALGLVSGNTTLTVSAATLTTIAVTPAKPTIPSGITEQFVATGTYSDGSNQNISTLVTWSSGSPANATVDGGGLVTAAAGGSSVITAALGTVSGNTTLTVSTAVLLTIRVAPASPTIPNGLTQQFTATGTYSDGTSYDITGSVTWTSGAPVNAAISNGSSVVAIWNIADPQLACQLQRSTSPAGFWQSASGWLPRGVVECLDTPPTGGAYAYQVIGRDIYGQVTAATVVVTIQTT